MTKSDGTTTRKTPVYVSEEDPSEWEDAGATFKPSQATTPWNPLTALKSLTECTLTVTATSTVITVTVVTTCGQVPVEGLVEGDFSFLLSGTPITGTFAEVGDGVYTLTGTGYTAGTVGLVAGASMTTEGYADNGTPVAFTV